MFDGTLREVAASLDEADDTCRLTAGEPGNERPLSIAHFIMCRVTWGMTAPGVSLTVPPPVDNLKILRTFTEYT